MAKKQTYSVELKLQAVELYISGELGGYRPVAEQFNVHATQVMRWVKAYKEEGIDGLKEKQSALAGRKPQNPSDQEKIRRLEAEV